MLGRGRSIKGMEAKRRFTMGTVTDELHTLIDAYRISETPTDALALADFLVETMRAPYLVEDMSDGMVYAWETKQDAIDYANTCLSMQPKPGLGEHPAGVNHKTRKLLVIDEQESWQSSVR